MRKIIGLIILSAAVLSLTVSVFAQTDYSYSIASVTGNTKVDKLLSQMTLEEKISLLHGGIEQSPSGIGQAGTWPGLPRLGIPSLRLADGPQGVSVNIWSTGMTSTMGLASTWSREDARKNGMVIGRDARAFGMDVVLEPFINIARDFSFSRAYNTFGEDPYLSGQIGAGQITGTQAEGVMAQAKHFIGYDGTMNELIVDGQTLREIYIAPFADAVNADVSSIMCSYNRINGVFACDSNETVNQILRGENGFRGFNTSDWGGTHGTSNVANGLDMEMPGGNYSLATANAGGRRGMGGMMPGGFPGGGMPGMAPGGATGTGRGPQGSTSQPGGMTMPPMGGRGGQPEEAASPNRGQTYMGATPAIGTDDPPAYGMLKAVKDKLISERQISLAVGHILVMMDKFGYLDKAPKHTVTEIDYAYNAPVLQKTAEDAAILLKNQDGVLPITNEDLSSTAFIGPNGGVLISIGLGGEKAQGLPDHQIGPVPAMEKITGKKLIYEPANDFDGKPVPASALSNVLRTNTATNQTQSDSEINFTSSNGKALPEGTSFTWKGTLTVPGDGDYIIALQTRGTTGSLTIDGNAVGGGGGFPGMMPGGMGPGGGIPGAPGTTAAAGAMPGDNRGGQSSPSLDTMPGIKGQHPISGDVMPTADHLNNSRTKVNLKAGMHEFTLTTRGEQYGFPVQVRLAWVTPEQQKANYEAAISAARKAKKAVVFAWQRQTPLFGLPGDQDKLITDVAAVNPNTIVVLNTSLPVEMPWINKVKAVIEAWYPGDEGGPAMANILLGKANPAGRLPVSWPVKLSDMVAQDSASHPERTNEGVDGKTYYTEGLFVGYRWFDKQDIKPLFPFGHGLSYSAFQYSGLKVSRAPDGGLNVIITIKNTGKVAGDEVPQVYIGAPKNPPSGAQFAVKQLVQFDRVTIPPGMSKTITLKVEPRRLKYWSVAKNRWEYATGPRTVYVGASSRDLRLQAETNIAELQ